MSDFLSQLAERVDAIWYAPWPEGLKAAEAAVRYGQARAILAVAEKEPVGDSESSIATIRRRVRALRLLKRAAMESDGTYVPKKRKAVVPA